MNRIIICVGMLYAFTGMAQLVLKSGTTASNTTNSNSLFTNGKVAIGGFTNGTLPTTDPSYQLQVTGSTRMFHTSTGFLSALNVAGDQEMDSEYNKLYFGNKTKNYGYITGDDGQNKKLFLYHPLAIRLSNSPVGATNFNEGLYVSDGNRIGINTFPKDKLHVNVLGSFARFDVSTEGATVAEPNRITLGLNNKTAISFVPWAPNNAWIHVHHTHNSALMISHGGVVGENPMVTFKANGQVIMGAKCPNNNAYNDQDAKLMVVGKIVAKEVVTLSDDASWKNFPDYVFNKDYKLMPLDSLQQYITANKHLPEIPSAKEVSENGINLSQLAAQQMKKIEELTLYLLEQQKQIDALRQELNAIKK